MSTPLKVAAFVLALVVAFVGARGVGAAVGPLAVEEPAAHGGADHDGADHGDERAAPAPAEPGGLAVSRDGYTLRVLSAGPEGRERQLRFVVEGPDGRAVTAYEEVHERRLHLVAIRRDGAGYQHVHPRMAADGTWTARLALAPGSTRLLADFRPTDGPELVLGTDVEVPGDYRPVRGAALARVARVGGYQVALAGELVAGDSTLLTATVTRGGAPVTDLQPYLGARGHLVALREGDLAYLHVHPEESGSGPDVGFHVEVPSDGRYRLFLDFRHADRVRTAAFTLATGAVDHGGERGEGHDH